MKITYLKLVNFIGILHGTGKTEIELDFVKDVDGNAITDARVVMLSGKNGSGKTTILSQLHPFKRSFDDRKNVIIPEKEGIKEIHIQDKGNLYEITHIYGVKQSRTKSFVKKNGEELNTSGSVESAEQIIGVELGVTTDYFNIGKIGSNVSNFVDAVPSERNAFINKLCASGEEFNAAFDIVKAKHKALTDTAKIIAQSLGDTNTEYVLSEKLLGVDSQIETKTKQLNDMRENAGALKGIDDKLTSENDLLSIANMKDELKRYMTSLEKLFSARDAFANKYGCSPNSEEIKAKVADLNESLAVLIGECNVLTEKRNNYIARATEESDEIKRLTSKKIAYGDVSSVGRLTIEADQLEAKLQQANAKPRILGDLVDKNNVYTSTRNIAVNKGTFYNLIMYISENYQEIKNNLSIFKTRLIEGGGINTQKEEDAYTSLQESVRNAQLNKASLMANSDQLEILEQRPSGCAIDACPFIANALKYKNLNEDISKADANIAKLKEACGAAEIAESAAQRRREVYVYFSGHYNKNINNPLTPLICKEAFGVTNLNEMLSEINKLDENTFRDKYETLSDTIDTEIENINTIVSYENDLKVRRSTIEQMSSKSKELEEVDAQIERHTGIKNGFDDELKTITTETTAKIQLRNDATNEVNDWKSYGIFFDNYENIQNRITFLTEEITRLSDIKSRHENYVVDIRRLTDDISNLTNELYVIKQSRDSIKANLAKVIENTKLKKDLDDKLGTMSTIKMALDPTKGIPLVFNRVFMEKVKLVTNELLAASFGGMFAIDFKIESKMFKIMVKTGIDVKDDIKEASQGEVALTTISICLALLEQSAGRYNILTLDEMDGALDSNNRQCFIDILNKQIDRLGIEQVFVISHNNCFDSYPMSIIALKDNDLPITDKHFMSNKQLVYNFNKR